MTLNDISRLKSLLKQMQTADPGFRVSGSKSHRYQLGPTLSEFEIAGFEQKHGIRLPDDYRLFLREAGHDPAASCRTGAGPSYGMHTLELAVDGVDLSSPFPFPASQKEISFEEVRAWEMANEDEFPGGPGGLRIADQGTGFDFLVVNGPAYGTVWEVFDDYRQTGTSFGDWYRQWMTFLSDRALPVLAAEKAAAGVTVGMSKAEVIRLCGGRWKQVAEFEEPGSELVFAQLATVYELDQHERVSRIIDHFVSEWSPFNSATEDILDAS